MKRIVPIALAAALLGGLGAVATPASAGCTHRLLILSAFPGEIDKLLTSARVTSTVVVDGRSFFVGRLAGNDVVLALTGIGLVNADHTTRTALARFRCGSEAAIDGIVFSGVAGGRSFIGDVTIPERWTLDDGKTWMPADAGMLAVAHAAAGGVHLGDRVPVGDLACVGLDPELIRMYRMPHHPQVLFGGDGKSADPFGGRAFPCVPGGGDVFGCQPCRAPSKTLPDVVRFLRDAAPFVDPGFFLGYFQSPTPSTTTYEAEDMETGAVARVAQENGIPFIAFRAMSDGKGDPLRLPGFPFQFFVYRQLAADNAGTTALAFLEAWAAQ